MGLNKVRLGMGNRRIRSHLSFLFLLVRDRSVMVTSILATIADAEDNTICELCKGVPHGKTQDMEFSRASHIALQLGIFVIDGHESNVLGIRPLLAHFRRDRAFTALLGGQYFSFLFSYGMRAG